MARKGKVAVGLFLMLVGCWTTTIGICGRRITVGGFRSGNVMKNDLSDDRGDEGKYVVKCYFTTSRTAPPSAAQETAHFFIPKRDQELYEKGVNELLSQMTPSSPPSSAPASQDASAASLKVICEEIGDDEKLKKTCGVCFYSEISSDNKHVRQGQVIAASLTECMSGTFPQGGRMLPMAPPSPSSPAQKVPSEYHPICYPPSAEEKKITTA